MDRQNENQLGNRIAELRKEAGLTQEQLAGMLGVTYQAVSKWETGNSYPDISLLPRLSEIFHVSLDSLFGKEDNTILTEHVLEKAVQAASMEQREEEESEAQEAEKTKQESGREEADEKIDGNDGAGESETDDGKKEETGRKRESDSAQSFGEYIGNIVNMSLKSGMNGLGKAMDTLKKIDFKSLDLKDLDQSISDKVKRAVEKGKKSRFWDKREEAGEAKEEAAEEKAADEAEEETAGEDSRQETAESAEDRLFREMEGWKGHTIHLTIGGKMADSNPGEDEILPWEDDGKIRAVVYLGKRMLSAREYRNMRGRITFEMEGIARDVITYMNVSCEDVAGNIKAGGDVNCDRVEGNVAAERQVSCDCVKGSVFAGEGVTCDNVQGDVVAGGSVTCDTVNQNVTAGGSVRSDTIHGNVMAPHVEKG